MALAIDGEVRVYLQHDDLVTPNQGIWHDVGSLLTISDIGPTKDEIDVTLLSNTDGFKSFIPALKDAGTIDITLLYDKTQHNKILYQLIPQGKWKYRVVLRENDVMYVSWEFTALFTKHGVKIEVADKIESVFTLRVGGEEDFSIH